VGLRDLLPTRRGELVRVLEADPGLGAALARDDLAAAREALLARVLELSPGPWLPPGRKERGEIGLLVLEGLLQRDVQLAGIGCTELIGRGDLIRPWEEDEGAPSLPFEVAWVALEPTRLAVLDERFAAGLERWPEISAQLVGRAARLTHSVAVHFALTCFIGLDVRLYVLFWHLADRFGRVERDGVVLPLRLTHETIGRLVRARRPSVTSALARLTERGLVVRRDDGTWLLRGDPPAELDRLRAEAGGADGRPG